MNVYMNFTILTFVFFFSIYSFIILIRSSNNNRSICFNCYSLGYFFFFTFKVCVYTSISS